MRRLGSTTGAAAVAGAATGWMRFSKVVPDEHASAFLRLGVVGNQPKTPLALEAKSLELRDKFADTPGEFVRWHSDNDAAVLVALNKAGLFEIRKQYLADPGGYTGGVGKVFGRRGALLGGPGGERGLKALQMPDVWAAEALKPLLDFKIGRVEQEDAVRGLPVATGAADLLNILLKGAGSVVVEDVANVRLVDAHTEGAGGHHDQSPGRIHELALRGGTVRSAHLAVIAHHGDARPCQRAAHLIHRGGGGAVDDAWPAQALDAPRGSRKLLGTRDGFDCQAKVGAVRGSRQDEGVA